MRDETVARNYAETLFELAEREGDIEGFEHGIEMVAHLIDQDRRVQEFVETPRISSSAKKRALEKAVGEHLPLLVLNFVKVVIDKRRQRLIRDIAREFRNLADRHAGRIHVDLTVARPLDDGAVAALGQRLSRSFGKTVTPHVQVRPHILGGVVVRTGDTIYDGSVRRQIEGMRRRLLSAELPAFAAD